MRCYMCKEEVSEAWRVFMPPKNKREKSKVRDLCEACYLRYRSSEYIKQDNVWIKKQATI